MCIRDSGNTSNSLNINTEIGDTYKWSGNYMWQSKKNYKARIVVFYAGTNVEEALAEDFEDEQRLRHPYTKALFRAMPRHGFKAASGTQPYVADMPAGCPYGPRCPDMDEGCLQEISYRSFRGGMVKCRKAGI